MLPRHPHFLGEVRKREGGRSALESVVSVLPGNPIEDDRGELVGRSCRFAFKGEMTSSTKSMGVLCH